MPTRKTTKRRTASVPVKSVRLSFENRRISRSLSARHHANKPTLIPLPNAPIAPSVGAEKPAKSLQTHEKEYEEDAHMPEFDPTLLLNIQWDKRQDVREYHVEGYSRTYQKRAERARPNPWRRYGALSKLHEIGGWITRAGKRQVSRKNRKYFYIKPGTKGFVQPNRPPISIAHSRISGVNSIMLPMEGDVDEIALVSGQKLQEIFYKGDLVD